MTLSSMTGFARLDGMSGVYVWAWELKSVNGKGLELRVRVPPGWDVLEVAVRERLKGLARGTIHANLSVKREGSAPVVRVNAPVLDAVLATMRELATRTDARPASMDGILGLKGVIEVVEEEEQDDARKAAEADILAGFEAALKALVTMRRHEGGVLRTILAERLDEIELLNRRADASPGRQPAAIQARLREQIAVLLETGHKLDP